MRRGKYICQQCGYVSSTWMGRCPSCGAWNSFVEMREERASAGLSEIPASSPTKLSDVKVKPLRELRTGISELDRVLGGRLVRGSIVLIAGAPGIGKSTLALQMAISLASQGTNVLYATAEETAEQVKMRFDRLSGDAIDHLFLLETQNLRHLLDVASEYEVVILDSVQAFHLPELDSPPSSVSQVKAIAYEVLSYAKSNDITFLMLAHVTKEGLVAGPKYLEHMVDVVLMMETYESYRVLRAVKNRYGRSGEIGLFEMTVSGLREVGELSWLSSNLRDPGVTAFISLEGQRPITVEIQSLVTRSYSERVKRLSWGLDPIRLDVILSILSKYLKLKLYQYDVIINVNGAIKLYTQDSDLAIAASVLSSLKAQPLPPYVFLARLSLQGRLQPVPNLELRLAEAEKLGFKGCVISSLDREPGGFGLDVIKVDRIEAIGELI